jgi:hypothetical protein
VPSAYGEKNLSSSLDIPFLDPVYP